MSQYVPPPAGAVSARLDAAKMKKIAMASVIGTTVEWYDLFLFGTASALVFNKIFFPSFDPVVGTLLAFGRFAAAYLARTIGAIIFGHFGDRLGSQRRPAKPRRRRRRYLRESQSSRGSADTRERQSHRNPHQLA